MANSPALTASDVERLYGGAPVDDTYEKSIGAAEPRHQYVGESLNFGTVYNRRVRGPKLTGHFSLGFHVDTPGGVGSAATVWYSVMPDPDPTTDTDWFQDSTIGTVDLTVGGAKVFPYVAAYVPWIKVKATPLVSNPVVRVFIRREGVDAR